MVKEIGFAIKAVKIFFLGLQKLLGKPIPMGRDNMTWTLTKYECHNDDVVAPDLEALTHNHSKLRVAVGVMHECFEHVKEPGTNRDLVEDVVFSRGSNLNRLNFRGFYTVLLERKDELITVANIRVHGAKVAEVPLVGTRFEYRRRGMCRLLMDALEMRLAELGVERLVLPAVPSVLNTWTSSFGFSKMTDSERSELLNYTFLDFQGTIMCQKLLNKKLPSAQASLPRTLPEIDRYGDSDNDISQVSQSEDSDSEDDIYFLK